MSNIGDGFKNIFLAGIGAMAYTGEKGEITLDQGRELNDELQRKASETTQSIRESALEATMRAMSPDERDGFAAKAAEFAAAQNAADAEKAAQAEVEAEIIDEEVVVETVEEAAEAAAEATAEAVDDEG